MTGEMYKPENAHRKDESYWIGRTGVWGTSLLGDDGVLIYPNYPEIFDLAEKIKKNTGYSAEPKPFDVYQGAYILVEGRVKIWKGETILTDEVVQQWFIEPYFPNRDGITVDSKDVYKILREILGGDKRKRKPQGAQAVAKLWEKEHNFGNKRR